MAAAVAAVSAAESEIIRLRGVSKVYELGQDVVHALDAVDLSIGRNEYVAVIGSSGSGKSTMMNILGCLDRPSAGDYLLNGCDVQQLDQNRLADIRNREIGFIFQTFNLIPRKSALDNVMQPLLYRGTAHASRRAAAIRSLERVGLGNRMHHLPSQLSGGQRQRVAIARALVTQPSLLLADEPTGNLDSATTADIMAMFDELHSQGQTVVIITHEPEIAAHCRRVVRLKDGRIVDDYFNERRPC